MKRFLIVLLCLVLCASLSLAETVLKLLKKE